MCPNRSLIAEASGGEFASELVLGDDMVEPGEAAAVGTLVVVACEGVCVCVCVLQCEGA